MTTCEYGNGLGTGAADMPGTGAFGRFAAAMRRRMEIARHERHLRQLPDSILKDIGLHRSEISAIARFGRTGYGG